MKKDEGVKVLAELLAFEEGPNFVGLEEINELIRNSEFNKETEEYLKKLLLSLKKDSAIHVSVFSEILREVAQGKKNEY